MITSDRPRRRSVGYLEHDDETWACFLVTFVGHDQRWRGYLSFRPREGEVVEDEIRTADIFLEASESEIDQKARRLGRPLLTGLLSSALHTREREADGTLRLRRWFRTMLAENARELAAEAEDRAAGEGEDTVADLRSLYASYRLDQVAHFISLVRPRDFDEAVDRILDGESIDFGTRDRLQFAMMVVEYIEKRLPLPPFETWVEDFVANRDAYTMYAHTLHRAGRLP